jgi:hypothetical protein
MMPIGMVVLYAATEKLRIVDVEINNKSPQMPANLPTIPTGHSQDSDQTDQPRAKRPRYD